MAPRWVIGLLMTGLQLCVATEVAPPPLTQKGLLGRWEGSAGGLDWWFRMDLFPGGGYLVVARKADHDIYRLEESKITGRNEVSLRFRGGSSTLPEDCYDRSHWLFTPLGRWRATCNNSGISV
jgi:hypothetical protein